MRFFRLFPFFAPDGDGTGDDLTGKITFTPEQQAEMDRIIGQRITSVKASMADYADLKEIADTLPMFGYEGTIADRKAALKQEAETRKAARELADLKDEADKTGDSPEMLARLKKAEEKLAKIDEKEQQQKKELEDKQRADESFQEQVKEFETAHPDVDIKKLGENKKFLSFVEKASPALTLLERYDTYIELIGDAEKAAIAKIQSNNERSTSSGRSKGDPTGGTYGLNDYQQKLAAQNGMTFKEYADLQTHVRK